MIEEEGVRRGRLEALRKEGIDPYPAVIERSHEARAFNAQFRDFLQSKLVVTVVGRILAIRKHGGMTFVVLEDGTDRLQVALKRDDIGESAYAHFHDHFDNGDFLQAQGVAYLTKTEEPTVLASSVRMLTKSLLPLPEKWHGLTDVETRYRQRELDLLANKDVRQRFIVRSKLISSLRQYLDERGFLEVETPILQPIPGGANARPFSTHHNALNADLYLRIAPELYLKRLIVGGFEKVYEIGRLFRNEGIDQSHNPEFTTIELYWAFVNKEEFVQELEGIMTHIVRASLGDLRVEHQGTTIDFSGSWPRMTFRDAVLGSCGIDINELKTPEAVEKASKQAGLNIDFSRCVGVGEFYDELFKKTARTAIEQPTWIFDYPIELKPLARQNPNDPTKSASVQLIVKGQEIINAYYHELNDPIEQRRRLEEQQALREQGSHVAQFMDEEFLQALSHGMPPTSGMGIGIDRLVAFLTNSPNLKEIILFPTLRPESPPSV
ncbi:MAG: lysine--tRNA ligase [Patescibacteria group bacterium]